MTDWIKTNNTLENWIKIVLVLFSVAFFVIAMDFKVDAVEAKQEKHIQDYEQFRYQAIPDTYMRKDVAEQVIIRLERIERKIDNMNSE